MILVNGSKGIGTGFSTDIMCYDPVSIIDAISGALSSVAANEVAQASEASVAEDCTATLSCKNITPYYEGFKGTITPLNDTDTKYLVKGKYEVLSAKQIRITELPVGTWTDDYKEYLEELMTPPDKKKDKEKEKEKEKEVLLRDYSDMSTDKVVDITLTFANGAIEKLVAETTGVEGCNGLEKYLKLYTTRSTTNMHMFDENEKLCHFNSVSDVIKHYMKVRLGIYVKRKAFQIEQLKRETDLLKNKARFITELLSCAIDMRGKKKEQVSEMLFSSGYKKIDDDDGYKYLVKMPMDMVTAENVDQLNAEKNKKIAELELLEKTSEKQIWLSELVEMKKQYTEYKKERSNDGAVVVKKKLIVKKTKVVAE